MVAPAAARHWVQKGWLRFAPEARLAAWCRAVKPVARATLDDPAQAQWHRAGGTWFVGVNALPNDTGGAVPGGPPLRGAAVAFAHRIHGARLRWDRAQISVIRPGYPLQAGESDAAFRFRRQRDAAHVDGLHAVGPDKRRFLREPHAFILGIPLGVTSPGASPLVVWEGSHRLMGRALRAALRGVPPERWETVDLTEAYHAARRACFQTCRRVAVHARPGQAYLLHRLALHGVSPWQEGATAPPEGRMIAYFRPALADPGRWLAPG